MFKSLFNYTVRIYRLPLIILILSGACGRVQPLREVFKKQTAYEKYEQALKSAKLENTALGREWIQAGQQALKDSFIISVPFKETGYFSADKPTAISYQLDARRGQRLVIGTEIKSTEPVRLFIDIFEMSTGRTPKQVASADTSTASVTYEVEEDQIHLIRLQPELLTSGNYTITITREPTLAFPVPGKTSKQIGSFWGVPRDGGARSHEGIDIFAKKGSPAVAATDGFISAVNENRLGGKVVWLADEKRRQTLYYAHLDSQIVRPGQRVMKGDTIGLIGNTGNARTTAAHLHFGIYRSGRGAFDPFPSVQIATEPPRPVTADMKRLATWARVAARKGNVRLSPDAKAAILIELPKYTPVYILAGVGDWYKVSLPTRQTGYISSNLVENLEKPLRNEPIESPSLLLEQPDTLAPYMAELESGSSVPVLAETDSFLFVKTETGKTGWVTKAAE